MAAGPSAGVGNRIITFEQNENMMSSKTTYNWKINRFDVEYYPIHYEPEDPFTAGGDIFRPSHALRNKLVSQKFVAGEEAGLKSQWHVELDVVYAEQWMGFGGPVDGWEFEASLVFDEYLGNAVSWKSFLCHAKISMIEPETSRRITNLNPELRAVKVEKNGQRIAFTHGGAAMFEKDHSGPVKRTICLSVEFEIFGD